MTSLSTSASRGQPNIHLIDREADVLTDLALRIEPDQPQLARLLMDEIDRAAIHTADAIPGHIVTMNSHVDFVDETSGVRRSVQLVYPNRADIDAGRISVMTPMGAGLIGMAEGASIDWPDRDGQPHRLRIEQVRPDDSESPS